MSDAGYKVRMQNIDSYETFQTDLVPYTGVIEHLFTHCLIAFPEICYAGNRMTPSLDRDCITPYEFKKVLQSLYINDYILIDANLIAGTTKDGNVKLLTPLMLPKGKKPVILSVDDVVYDANKAYTGMVDKLILDNHGNIATYTKLSDGTEVISRDNEVFPILDDFVTEHPDFSFQGVKGTIALTGFQGILGYRTQSGGPAGVDRSAEREAAAKVAGALKDDGWNFGSHSYGHSHMDTKMSLASVKNDIKRWHDEVGPIVGDTCLFFYPYGETVKYGDPKYDALYEAGFRLFFGVSWKYPYLEAMPNDKGVLQTRRNIDGYTLRNGHEALFQFFDTLDVIDPIRNKL